MAKMVTLTIDGKKVTVPEGTIVVDAAKEAGVNIPVFCYHPKLQPVGMCRMCLVEIGRPMVDRATGEVVKEADGTPKISFGPKLETSCTTPVSEGMAVVTTSEKVTDARKDVLEFILTSHPLDCPICDKGGECPLQNLTMAFGAGESRYNFNEKNHAAKHVSLGELIFLDRERCIQCGRCVRFQSEIAGEPVIGFSQRGRSLEIVTHGTPGFDSIFSGNTSDICPVGALTTADFRFGARPWEMKYTASICNHCPVGCNIVYNVRREARSNGDMVIKRVMPRQNEWVNEIWMCDKGRLGYHYAESDQRLRKPLVRKEGQLVEVSWDEALEAAGRGLSLSRKMAVLAGGHLTNEDLFNLNKLGTDRKGDLLLYSYMAGGDLTAQVGLGKGSNLGDLGAGTTLMVVASDLHEEAPLWWLRIKQAVSRGAQLIVVSPQSTSMDRFAQHMIRCEYGQEAEMVKAFLPGQHTQADETLQAAVDSFTKAENAIIFYGSQGLGLEGSAVLANACAKVLIESDHVGKANNGLVAVWHAANLQGAWDMGFKPMPKLADQLKQYDALVVAGADPAGDGLSLSNVLKSPELFVVVQELFLSETARLADVVLPVLAPTEREGSYTSGERRVQRFYPVNTPADLKADYAVTASIAHTLGLALEDRSASLIMQQIAAQVDGYAGLSYTRLSEAVKQTPDVNRHDLYYGGTTYENRQGVGVQLEIDAVHGRLMKLEDKPAVNLPVAGEDQLLLLPVTKLYDHGALLAMTNLLDQRKTTLFLKLNLASAEKLGIQQEKSCLMEINGQACSFDIVLDDSVPAGVGLVPRSAGAPLLSPVVATLERAR